uniref:Putative secreted protein n=1 Tax=Anopheles marajoara TaxID=58244 RepID=A0A2M4C7H6_9DIPT
MPLACVLLAFPNLQLQFGFFCFSFKPLKCKSNDQTTTTMTPSASAILKEAAIVMCAHLGGRYTPRSPAVSLLRTEWGCLPRSHFRSTSPFAWSSRFENDQRSRGWLLVGFCPVELLLLLLMRQQLGWIHHQVTPNNNNNEKKSR